MDQSCKVGGSSCAGSKASTFPMAKTRKVEKMRDNYDERLRSSFIESFCAERLPYAERKAQICSRKSSAASSF